MNREIKFRAYSNQADKIMDWEFIKSVGNLTKLICLNHVDVMQYTGLKDKEGKDIYEGDILEHITDKNATRKKVVYDAQHGAFIMKCDKYFAELRATYGDENMYADTYLIIGNIFENAELLTTQAGGV